MQYTGYRNIVARFIIVPMNNGIRYGFRNDGFNFGQFVHGRVQLCHKRSNCHPGKRFIFAYTRKLDIHFIFHDAPPSVNNACSSYSSSLTILNKPDISNNLLPGGETEHTTISPPSCSTSLYLPRTTPSPELSMNVTDSRFSTTCLMAFVYIISFHSLRNASASWWSNSPDILTTRTSSLTSNAVDKPILFPPHFFVLDTFSLKAGLIPAS